MKNKRRFESEPSSVASVDEMHQSTTVNSQVDESNIGVPSRFCSVCGDVSTGIHFGGNSCESCKAFFRRSVQCNRYQNYKCSNDEHCSVNLVSRKVCQFCRYAKCTTVGMKPKWVLSDQEREEKYGSRRKRFRQNQVTEEDPDIYKYLTKDEKSLIEDIAQALYQSRATYPLQFPAQLNQYLKLLASGNAPAIPSTTNPTSTEKQPNPSANFLIVPIRRSVLFARMLKDFEIFSEDDKVNLLKGSAIESIVWSSNTLFDPKTHTFTNYVSRDQRAVMDEQVIPLDPLLKKLWGEDLFDRTTQFLVAMCNLEIDEVTSTLLVPVILFSPDRSNIKDIESVKRLQIKYVTILRKYMLWRYGQEKTELVYPKLLLQIINIRTLSLAHAEIIQKVMATSAVDPLVKEVTNKPEAIIPSSSSTTAPDSTNSVSSTNDNQMDSIRTPMSDTESMMGSDEEGIHRKKSRASIDDDEDSNESNIRNIWKKQRKCSIVNQIEQPVNSPSTYENIKQVCKQNPTQRKPHDHQVPNFISTCKDDLSTNNRTSSYRHLPPKKQSFFANRDEHHEQSYQQKSPSSVSNEMSSYDHYLRPNSATSSPLSKPLYDNYHPAFSPMSPSTTFHHQQQQNEQHLLNLSLANQQTTKSSSSSTIPKSHSLSSLKPDEQQLLDAIHAHPNKRDLVLNLLRQMNDSSTTPNSNSFHQ